VDLVNHPSTHSVSLIGVLGATTACKRRDYIFISSRLAQAAFAVTSIRAIGRRAHPMHAMVSFSVVCVIMASVG
jgi:hypothetical protein